MFKYLLKRLFQSFITIMLVISVVFLLMRLMPTDYFFTEDELIHLSEQQMADRLHAEGLDLPAFVQLGRYLKNLLTKFDFGTSHRIQTGVAVTKIMGDKALYSLNLGLIALVIALIIGVPLGILQAQFKNSIGDAIGQGFTIFVNAVPSLVSYSLIMVFGARVCGLPSQFSTRKVWRFDIFGLPAEFNYSMILPIVALALGSIAYYMMWMRRYMVDELNKEYIRLAKLKGLSNTKVMFTHVLRNAFLPLAQYLPYSILLTVGGSILVERFYAVPGLGPLLTDAIGKYDLNMVQAMVSMYAALGIIGLLLGDILLVVLDPRITLDTKGGTR